jgi:hypothetical protein
MTAAAKCSPRQHRYQAEYPALWRAVDGAIRAAMHEHPDIILHDKRRPSVVKRIVGQVLALGQGRGDPATGGSAMLEPNLQDCGSSAAVVAPPGASRLPGGNPMKGEPE